MKYQEILMNDHGILQKGYTVIMAEDEVLLCLSVNDNSVALNLTPYECMRLAEMIRKTANFADPQSVALFDC